MLASLLQCFGWAEWKFHHMVTIPKNGTKIKIWPPDFAQKNIYRIFNLSNTINELILHKNFFCQNTDF
jgi:hypothetical protein